MPDISWEVGAAIFSAGWGSCYVVLHLPNKARIEKLEARLTEIEKAKDSRIAALEQKLGMI